MQKTEYLPDPEGFGTENGLDAVWAWEVFGGLSVEQACQKLASNPIFYSEAFMWMGQTAFAYYFQAIDRYLRQFSEGVGVDDSDDSKASVIAGALLSQFVGSGARDLIQITGQVRDLSAYVRSNLSQLASDPIEQADVDSAWQLLEDQLDWLASRVN